MVIFTHRRIGKRPYTVRFWRGVNMDKFFPFHGRVDANYNLLPHHHRELYTGTMFHYPVGGYGMGPDIVSEFVAWRCSVCLEMHHRFTLHEILLNNGEFYKVCVGDLSNRQDYDPNSDQTPTFATFYRELQDQGVMQNELFKKHCHHCRTQHWYAMKVEAFLYNVSRCVCEDDPPNSGVLAAVRYSKLLQYPVPGGRQEQHEQPNGDADRHQDQDEAQVNGGVHNHNADNNHGGHQDQDEPEVNNGDAHNHNADDDHEGHQDQAEPEQVNGDAHNHDADDNHEGNQDQDEAQVNGDVHNHNADDGHQDQDEPEQVNGDAHNHDADDNHEEAQVNGDAHNHSVDDNHEGHQDESQVNGDAHNHNVDDNQEGHQDQDESQVNGDVHNQDAEGNHGVHQDQGVALVNGDVHNHNADGNNGGHGDQYGEQVNGNGHNQLVPMIMERVPTMIVLLVIIFMLLTFKSSFLAE